MSNKQQPPSRAGRANSRERIIDAAIDLCCAAGVKHLSLDAVAERAGLSKGGLLYNFNSKSALLQAMVGRHVDVLTQAVSASSETIARDGRPNARIRAYLLAIRDLMAGKGQAPAGFLAAIAEEPRLLDPIRDHNARLVGDLRTESENPDLAIYAFMVVEGIRNIHLFDINPFGEGELVGYLDQLIERLAEGDGPRDPGDGADQAE